MVAPVANTITSTTSATQDLEVFKNFPTEKNNKLLQQKYGSQEEFFKKVAAEGYAEGFKGQELNLPATQMLDETAMKQFLDPSGLSAYKGTPLEQYAGTQDYTQPIPTLQSEFAGKEVPYSEVKEFLDKKRSGQISGVTELGQLMPKGEFGDTNLIRAETPVEKFGRADLRGKGLEPVPPINPIPQGQFNLQEEPRGIETIRPKITTLDDGLGYTDDQLRKMGFSEAQIQRGVQPSERPDREKINPIPQGEFERGEWSKGIPTKRTGGIDTIETDQKPKEDEPWAKKRLEELQFKMRNKKYFLKDMAEKWQDIDEVMELIGYKDRFKKLSIKEKTELGKKFGLTTMDLVGWDARTLVSGAAKVVGETAEDKKRAKNVGLDIGLGLTKDEGDEIRTRERILKEGGQRELDKYILNLAKEDDDDLEITVDIPIQDTTGSGRATDTGGLLEVQRRKMDQLMKDAEENKLDEDDTDEIKTELENQGIKTKGLTDKNMLLIAMGLGMMASEKPGLTGVGEGALTGLKTVAPLLTQKASDFQIVEVDDKDNPGQTKLVKINKRTNEVTDLGVGGKGKKTDTQKKYEWMSTITGKPVKNLVMRDLALKDKKKSKRERIEAMAKYVWGQDILGGVEADVAEYIKQATEMIEAIDKIPNTDLNDILGL